MPKITITATRETIKRESKTVTLDLTPEAADELRKAYPGSATMWAEQAATMDPAPWVDAGSPLRPRYETEWTITDEEPAE